MNEGILKCFKDYHFERLNRVPVHSVQTLLHSILLWWTVGIAMDPKQSLCFVGILFQCQFSFVHDVNGQILSGTNVLNSTDIIHKNIAALKSAHFLYLPARVGILQSLEVPLNENFCLISFPRLVSLSL